jgi:hypothetical protein
MLCVRYDIRAICEMLKMKLLPKPIVYIGISVYKQVGISGWTN